MSRSYSQGLSSTPLLGETIGENLHRAALTFPDVEALVVRSQGVRLTYRELEAQVRVVARGLLARGIARGDRVGIWSPNRVEWVLLQYATATMGAILVNINPAYKTAELEHALRQSGVSVLFSARTFRASDFAGMVEEVRGRCPALREVIILETGWRPFLDGADGVADRPARGAASRSSSPTTPSTSSTPRAPPASRRARRSPTTTSSTTASSSARGSGSPRRTASASRSPSTTASGWSSATSPAPRTARRMVIPGEAFEPLAVLEAVTAERCTALYGVPTMFIAILDHPRFGEFSFPTLRTGIMAGAPCPVEVMKKVQTLLNMPEVTICYGMTETSPVSTQTAVDDPIEKRTSTVGRVHPHIEVKILDPVHGRTVPREAKGELCTRGYSVMLSYWSDPEATRAAIDAAGWMHTGDLATMDEQGYVNIVGRIKDMIIRGGENVFPARSRSSSTDIRRSATWP